MSSSGTLVLVAALALNINVHANIIPLVRDSASSSLAS